MAGKTPEEGKAYSRHLGRNCKVFIRLNGTPEQAKVIAVRDIKDLERYK